MPAPDTGALLLGLPGAAAGTTGAERSGRDAPSSSDGFCTADTSFTSGGVGGDGRGAVAVGGGAEEGRLAAAAKAPREEAVSLAAPAGTAPSSDDRPGRGGKCVAVKFTDTCAGFFSAAAAAFPPDEGEESVLRGAPGVSTGPFVLPDPLRRTGAAASLTSLPPAFAPPAPPARLAPAPAPALWAARLLPALLLPVLPLPL